MPDRNFARVELIRNSTVPSTWGVYRGDHILCTCYAEAIAYQIAVCLNAVSGTPPYQLERDDNGRFFVKLEIDEATLERAGRAK